MVMDLLPHLHRLSQAPTAKPPASRIMQAQVTRLLQAMRLKCRARDSIDLVTTRIAPWPCGVLQHAMFLLEIFNRPFQRHRSQVETKAANCRILQPVTAWAGAKTCGGQCLHRALLVLCNLVSNTASARVTNYRCLETCTLVQPSWFAAKEPARPKLLLGGVGKMTRHVTNRFCSYDANKKAPQDLLVHLLHFLVTQIIEMGEHPLMRYR
mmetsp:Transcript_86705/g.135692  ORF Transcript_86705/g.135692 Transcript_86705/m.135692 type:complete len:210 (-) Transcript_86705:532-1161(-)